MNQKPPPRRTPEEPDEESDGPGLGRTILGRIRGIADVQVKPGTPTTGVDQLAGQRRFDLISAAYRSDDPVDFFQEFFNSRGQAQQFYDMLELAWPRRCPGRIRRTGSHPRSPARPVADRQHPKAGRRVRVDADDTFGADREFGGGQGRGAAELGGGLESDAELAEDSSERGNRIRTELRIELEMAEESATAARETSDNAGVSDETRDFVRREFDRVPQIFGVLPAGGRRAVATEAAINPTGEGGSSITADERARFGSAASADLVDNVAIALTAVTGPALVARAGQGGFTVIRGQAGREFLRRLPGTAARETASEAVEEGTFVAADFILTARAPDLGSLAEIGGEAGLETIASARRGQNQHQHRNRGRCDADPSWRCHRPGHELHGNHPDKSADQHPVHGHSRGYGRLGRWFARPSATPRVSRFLLAGSMPGIPADATLWRSGRG